MNGPPPERAATNTMRRQWPFGPAALKRTIRTVSVALALFAEPAIAQETKCPAQPSAAAEETFSRAMIVYREHNYKLAIQLFTKAAAQCKPGAEFMLGVLAHRGLGRPQSYQDAYRWYKKAADKGLAEAQSNLGLLYKNGLGDQRDYQQALGWYRLAADQGDAISQYQMGKMYADGLGVARNLETAREWMQKAIAGGSEDAKTWMAQNSPIGTAPPSAPPPTDKSGDLSNVVFLMPPHWVMFLDYPIKDRNLIFRRYSFVVDRMTFDSVDDNSDSGRQSSVDIATGNFINSMIYSCRPDISHPDHLVLHMPPNTTLQSFPLKEWVSQLEIKILADGYSRQFSSEYIKGDLFIDRPPGTAENFMRLLYANRLTVEFGTRNDRLSLAVEANFGPAAIDAAMRHLLPSSTGEKLSKITFLSTDDMVNTCLNFKRTGTVKPNIGGKYWLIWGSTFCPECDASKGKTGTTITIGNKKSKRITSEAQCKNMLTTFASSISEHKLEADLYCIRVDDRDLE